MTVLQLKVDKLLTLLLSMMRVTQLSMKELIL